MGGISLKYEKQQNCANQSQQRGRGRPRLLSYDELIYSWRKGARNGNWRRLRIIDRAFYRAATWYAKMKGIITNNRIIAQLRSILERIKNTIKAKIMSAGTDRAEDILAKFEERGVFNWAPQLKLWIKDPKYIFWLGLASQAPHCSWII